MGTLRLFQPTTSRPHSTSLTPSPWTLDTSVQAPPGREDVRSSQDSQHSPYQPPTAGSAVSSELLSSYLSSLHRSHFVATLSYIMNYLFIYQSIYSHYLPQKSQVVRFILKV